MTSITELIHLTDHATMLRGWQLAVTGRVGLLNNAAGVLRARVQGKSLYEVTCSGTTWACTCPAGSAEKLCEHSVAVVYEMNTGEGDIVFDGDDLGADEELADDGLFSLGPDLYPKLEIVVGDDDDGFDVPSPLGRLHALPPGELLALVERAVDEVDGFAEFLTAALLPAAGDGATGGYAGFREAVEYTLRPDRSSYGYRATSDYADDAATIVDAIETFVEEPTPELLSIIERAVALTIQTAERADDSMGMLGEEIERLLQFHTITAVGLADSLDPAARRRIATWLHDLVFSDSFDYSEPRIDVYAPVLGEDGLSKYKALVEHSLELGRNPWAARTTLGNIAILSGDTSEIVRVLGGDLTAQDQAARVVAALDQAGHQDKAIEHAKRGLKLPRSGHHSVLVERLVTAAQGRGDLTGVLEVRQEHFDADPGRKTFDALQEAALETDGWDRVKAAAEAELAAKAPRDFLQLLLDLSRNDAAWEFAHAHPDAAQWKWEELCGRRSSTAPADTLPVYRELIEEQLTTASNDAYLTAARLLLKMRKAADLCGQRTEFDTFMSVTEEGNRRRPNCMKAFKRAGLI